MEIDSDAEKKQEEPKGPKQKTFQVPLFECESPNKTAPAKEKKEDTKKKTPVKPAKDWTFEERRAWVKRESADNWRQKAKDTVSGSSKEKAEAEKNLLASFNKAEASDMIRDFMRYALHYWDIEELKKTFTDPLESYKKEPESYPKEHVRFMKAVYHFVPNEFGAEHHSKLQKKASK